MVTLFRFKIENISEDVAKDVAEKLKSQRGKTVFVKGTNSLYMESSYDLTKTIQQLIPGCSFYRYIEYPTLESYFTVDQQVDHHFISCKEDISSAVLAADRLYMIGREAEELAAYFEDPRLDAENLSDLVSDLVDLSGYLSKQLEDILNAKALDKNSKA